MKKFLCICFALLGFVFASFGKSIDDFVLHDFIKDAGKENITSLIEIVDVNSAKFIYVQNRITYNEFQSWRLCEMGYNKVAEQII